MKSESACRVLFVSDLVAGEVVQPIERAAVVLKRNIGTGGKGQISNGSIESIGIASDIETPVLAFMGR
jgi:hypothetical protein